MDVTLEREPAGPYRLVWPGGSAPCAIGRGGIRQDKREGDGATPTGRFPFRRLLYRADRVPTPVTGLPTAALRPDDGWCDDPADPAYNRPVTLPFAASHERMWQEEPVYDLVLVLGHNDDPPVPGLGSAIFLHLARPRYEGTAGCVALALDDMQHLLADLQPGDHLLVPDQLAQDSR